MFGCGIRPQDGIAAVGSQNPERPDAGVRYFVVRSIDDVQNLEL
jgi:hypothetical protein